MNEIMTKTIFEIDKRHISTLEILLKWPLDTIIPALDVFRIALLNKQLNEIFCSFSPLVVFNDYLLKYLFIRLLMEKVVEAILCNVFLLYL